MSASSPDASSEKNDSSSSAEATLSPREIAELKRAFQAFVMKGSNAIPTKDLGNVLRSLGQNMSNLEILDMINELDENGDGRIQFEEFFKVIAPKFREMTISKEIQEAFRVFDKDGNGTVSMSEFRSVLSVAVPNLSKRELNEMLQDMDANHDGTVDYQEFVDLMGPVMDAS